MKLIIIALVIMIMALGIGLINQNIEINCNNYIGELNRDVPFKCLKESKTLEEIMNNKYVN